MRIQIKTKQVKICRTGLHVQQRHVNNFKIFFFKLIHGGDICVIID